MNLGFSGRLGAVSSKFGSSSKLGSTTKIGTTTKLGSTGQQHSLISSSISKLPGLFRKSSKKFGSMNTIFDEDTVGKKVGKGDFPIAKGVSRKKSMSAGQSSGKRKLMIRTSELKPHYRSTNEIIE